MGYVFIVGIVIAGLFFFRTTAARRPVAEGGSNSLIAIYLVIMGLCFYFAQSTYFTAIGLSDHGELASGMVTSDPVYRRGRYSPRGWQAKIEFEDADGATRSGKFVMQPYLKNIYIPGVSVDVLYLPENPGIYVAGKVKAALANMRKKAIVMFLLGLMTAGIVGWHMLKRTIRL